MYFSDTKTSLVSSEAKTEFFRKLKENSIKVDGWMGRLLLGQWAASILTALTCSPFAWRGANWQVHEHVWLAVCLGGLLSLPAWLISKFYAGNLSTRLFLASCQVLFSSLFIHLTSGRIETHFHVFVSMAILVGYRDRTVFIPAVILVAFDHLVHGYLWPQSVFGVSSVDWFRPFEHAMWLLFETAGLCVIVGENLRQWLSNAQLQRELAEERDRLENRVQLRTQQLASLQQFREEILHSIDASVCILNNQGRIVFVNRKWIELAEEVGADSCGIGTTYLDECGIARLGTPENAMFVAEAIESVASGNSGTICSEYETEVAGQPKCYRLSVSPIALDGEPGVAVVYVDVSHLKRAESRANALAALVLNSPDIVLIASAETNRFVEVNEVAARSTGYSRLELLEMNLVQLFCETEQLEVQSHIEKLTQANDVILRFESLISRKDASVFPCRISLHKTQFENTEVWALYVSDLSEQKELQDKLHQAQKLESLGTLAAGIAHEINTPMQCVVGNVEFLQSSIGRITQVTDHVSTLLTVSDIDWEQERSNLRELSKNSKYEYLRKQAPLAVEEAVEACRKIVDIVRAMKAMSHPGTDKAVVVDIHEQIRNASVISRNRWKNVATMVFEFSPDVTTLEAFPAELNQVFVNLFVNSTDAIVEKIGASPKELGSISVTTRLAGDRLVIEVRDSGVGIPESIRQRIFDPYFTTKAVGKGTGQGLAITRSAIVKKHRGNIQVSSQPGVGTVFTIELPLKHDAESDTVMPPIQTEFGQQSNSNLMGV